MLKADELLIAFASGQDPGFGRSRPAKSAPKAPLLQLQAKSLCPIYSSFHLHVCSYRM